MSLHLIELELSSESSLRSSPTNLDHSVNEDAILLLDNDDVDSHIFWQTDGGTVVASKTDLKNKKIL